MQSAVKCVAADQGWVKRIVETETIKRWNRRWLESPQYRQTKRFWPQVDKEISNDVTQLNRVDLSNVVQLLTGHGYNKHRQRRVATLDEEECRFCLEENCEDTWHIVNDCPAFDGARRSTLKDSIHTFNFQFPKDVLRLPTFILKADLGKLFNPMGY